MSPIHVWVGLPNVTLTSTVETFPLSPATAKVTSLAAPGDGAHPDPPSAIPPKLPALAGKVAAGVKIADFELASTEDDVDRNMQNPAVTNVRTTTE
jgi:hypothetical protein